MSDAAFVTWMQGLPQGWLVGKRNQQLKALGNAVVWPQARLALELLGLPDLTSTRREV